VIKALCVFFLVFGMASPASAGEEKSQTTILLVARAELPDPNFRSSLVLVMNHIGPAPIGVIVNRPTKIAVSRLFPDIKALAELDAKLYFGGPVELDSVSFVFRASKPPEDAARVLEGVYVSTNRELLRKLLRRDKPMEGLRIFIGYSGWAPGQLEAEIARGDWTLAPAEADTIFDEKSQHPWPEQQGVGRRT
jgi:putative transcriptional regulator